MSSVQTPAVFAKRNPEDSAVPVYVSVPVPDRTRSRYLNSGTGTETETERLKGEERLHR